MTVHAQVFMANELTCAVAATGLPGIREALATEPLDDGAWGDLLHHAQFHKMVPLVAAAIENGSLPATEAQKTAVRDAHARSMELCLELEQDLLSIADRLDAASVETRVLKGPSFAHLDYPDPALRAFGDIDLLVRSDQFDDAVRVLRASGFERGHREIRRGFDRRFGKGANFTGPHQLRGLDLHRTFVMGPFGLMIVLDELWEGGERFEVGGRGFLGLDPEQRFLHACFHAALGNARTRLVPLRDVAEMLLRPRRPIDLERALATSRRWKAEVVVMRAVDLAWTTLGLPESDLSRRAAGWVPSPREQQALRTYLDADMGFAARCFTAMRAIDHPRDKVAFAVALAFPDRTYGTGRHRGRLSRWRSATRQIFRLSRPGRRP